MKIKWLVFLLIFPCTLFANEQAEPVEQELPVATGAPFSGADQVFSLGKEHGLLVRTQIVKMYCHVAKCDEAMSREENQNE